MQNTSPARYFLPLHYPETEETNETEDTEGEEEYDEKPSTLFALRREMFMRNKR